MDKLFQSKWFIRVISLVLAVTLYLFVTMETNVSNTDSRIPIGPSTEVHVLESVPLKIKIDESQHVVSGVPDSVKVTLEGKMSTLTPIIRQQNFSVFVDLRELAEGDYTIPLETENLPNDVKAYIEPKTVDVTLEKRTSQEYSVEVDFVNKDKLPVGYELGVPELNPQTVTIVSSEGVINQIAMVKVFIDVKDLKESINNRDVPISVYDAQGNELKVKLEPESVAVSVQVDRPSKKVGLIPITEGELPDGFEIDEIVAPEEIEVFGNRALLNDLSEISTKAIDLSEIEKSGKHSVELDFPEGIIANNETVEIEILLEQTKEFTDIEISETGKADGDITYITPENQQITVRASGSDKLISDLKRRDIKATIDVADLESGRHQITLRLEGPDDVKLQTDQSRVTIEVE